MEQETIKINDQVKELAVKSGTPFEVVVDELRQLGEKANAIESVDDPNFKEVKKDMVAKRNYIKTYCLDARREIKKVAEGVSGVENKLYELFVPAEDRLTKMLEEDKAKKLRAEREAVMPVRKEKLATIGDEVEVEDETLLEMDEAAFTEYFNERQTAKIEADKEEIARKEAEIKEKEEAAQREAEAKEREEQARKEEREKAEQEAKEKEEEEKRQKWARRKNKLENVGMTLPEGTNRYVWRESQKFADENITITVDEVENMSDEDWGAFSTKLDVDFDRRKKAVEDEQKAADESEAKAKRERADRYKEWRAGHGWTEETAEDFYEKVEGENTGEKVILYKKVGKFDLTEL